MGAKEPLHRAKMELGYAGQAISRMKSAHSFAEFEAAWQDYLVRLEKAWNKTGDAFDDETYASWRGEHAHQRTTDDLLRYIKQCRNAEEHTVGDTLLKEEAGIAINPALGTTLHIKRMTIDQGRINIEGAYPGLAITYLPERAKLLPAVSRGVTTQPPTKHLGRPLPYTSPLAVAEAALAYYEDFVARAQVRFGAQAPGT